MIRQTEEKLNRAANIYYYGNKIKNQRTTEHRPISNIDTTTNKKSSHHKMNRNNHVVNYVQKSSRSSLSSPTTNHPADIDNNIIDDEIWKKASQEAQDKEKVKNLYASLKLTEMLLTEHKRLERNLARIRAEQEIELINQRAVSISYPKNLKNLEILDRVPSSLK